LERAARAVRRRRIDSHASALPSTQLAGVLEMRSDQRRVLTSKD
jgi:hypothetical protein